MLCRILRVATALVACRCVRDRPPKRRREQDLVRAETKLKEDPTITLLVNNVGFASVAPPLDANIQKMEDMIALNITAFTRLRVRNASPLRF